MPHEVCRKVDKCTGTSLAESCIHVFAESCSMLMRICGGMAQRHRGKPHGAESCICVIASSTFACSILFSFPALIVMSAQGFMLVMVCFGVLQHFHL